MLAGEHGVTPEAALRVLLQDAMRFYDALWDKTFAVSDDLLDQLAAEAHDEYIAGRTEEFDPETDPNAK